MQGSQSECIAACVVGVARGSLAQRRSEEFWVSRMRFVALPKVLRLSHLAVRERARARTAGRRHRAAEPVVEAHGGVLRVLHPHECAQNIRCASSTRVTLVTDICLRNQRARVPATQEQLSICVSGCNHVHTWSHANSRTSRDHDLEAGMRAPKKAELGTSPSHTRLA